MSDNSAAQNQIKQMLTMQDAMNSRVSDTWRENGYEWYRAIWVECAEMLDHHGWKWWKHQEIDIAQVQLELVDIFHFGLSLRLMAGATVESITDTLAIELTQSSHEKDFKIALENLASAAVSNKSFDAIALADCMRLMNMDLDELFEPSDDGSNNSEEQEIKSENDEQKSDNDIDGNNSMADQSESETTSDKEEIQYSLDSNISEIDQSESESTLDNHSISQSEDQSD